ncbi:MAG: GspE/PulE family protein [Desulfobulbaceae bacterium]|nr:GspE/PulE family protein [Desulfobulbaceae bacterium]
MSFLNSEALLDLLCEEKLMTDKQRQFVLQQRDKQRQNLLRKYGGRRRDDKRKVDKSEPELLDLIVSLRLEIGGNKGRILNEEIILRAVSFRKKIPFKKLDPLKLDIEIVTKTIPKTFAVSHLVLPFDIRNGVLEVVTCNPDNQTVLADIEQATQLKVRPYLSTRSDIKKMLVEFFGFQQSISAAEVQFGAPGVGPGVDIGNLEQYIKLSSAKELSSSDQHIKSAVNHIINYALDQRASDIHIEPKRDACEIRFRIDGVLHSIYKLPKAVHSAITSRIKTLSRLDIAEKRRPQDGRIKVGQSDEGSDVEIRVSTVPVAFGEKTVMRLLDSDVIFQDLNELGFSRRDAVVYNSFTSAPHGIIFVTGPTGSGKSTTLYSTLKKIATPEKNIVTVEDPVEMVYDEFNQIAVQSQIGVTFSTILRNILRQDPDIIMIGEIRDLETAVYAAQAALTGHLVFSTLHTNDAVSSIIRLEDLGLEPFLIASTMLGALAQRLVRRICPHCVESYKVDAQEIQRMGFPVSEKGEVVLQRGKGCHQCRGTGFSGRCAVFEVFPMSEQLKKLVTAKAPDAELRQVAIREGMTTLREDAWSKVRKGVTTLEEALRVTGEA